jgi:hypothetical protein
LFFQFLNLFGDVQSIKRVEDRHAKLFLPNRGLSELKKRHAEDFLASDKTKVSRAYSAQSPAQSVVGAYPNGPNQWPNYGVQPQTWPATTQAQGQQWPAGYTQQQVNWFLPSTIFLVCCFPSSNPRVAWCLSMTWAKLFYKLVSLSCRVVQYKLFFVFGNSGVHRCVITLIHEAL